MPSIVKEIGVVSLFKLHSEVATKTELRPVLCVFIQAF